MSEPQSCYPRDNSFYRTHGRAGRYHFLGDDLRSKCGKVRMLDIDSPAIASEIPTQLRCRLNGCKQLWRNAP